MAPFFPFERLHFSGLFNDMTLHSIDIAVIAAYLLLMLGLGVWFGGKQSRGEFFHAGGVMGWLPVGLSVMATLFSSNSFVFYPSAAFGDSLRIALSLVSFTLMTPVVIWVFIPIYSRAKVETAYEFLERRFHVSVRTVASGLFILLRIGWMASVAYAGAVVVASVTGMSQTLVVIVLGAVSIGYTMLGGLRAVMWTDVLQFFVFATTILGALALIVRLTDMSVAEMMGVYLEGRDNVWMDFTPSLTLPYGSWAILIGVFLEAVSAFGVDQVAVQRYLSARSERTSQWGAVVNLLGMWIVLPGLLMIGVALFAYYSQHPSALGAESLGEALRADPKLADRALPKFVGQHFPPGLAGLFLAALMAAIMSSIDSGVHSVTTAVVVDFRDRLFPECRPSSDRSEVVWIRVMVLAIGATVIVLACNVGSLGGVFDVGKKLTAAFGGPLLAIFVLAIFTRRTAWQSVLVGGVAATLGTLWLIYNRDWFSVWFWPVGFGASLALTMLCEFTGWAVFRNAKS